MITPERINSQVSAGHEKAIAYVDLWGGVLIHPGYVVCINLGQICIWLWIPSLHINLGLTNRFSAIVSNHLSMPCFTVDIPIEESTMKELDNKWGSEK